MATPFLNSVPVTLFDPAVIGDARYLAHGSKWGDVLGTGVTLTYSFPALGASREDPYAGRFFNEWDEFSPLFVQERAAVRSALSGWSSVTNITFLQVPDNATTVGEIRFGVTTVINPKFAAHAYVPDSDPSAGDVWFNGDSFNTDGPPTVPRDSYDFGTILHEIGHALGLKHPFKSPNRIPDSLDNLFFTQMSYTASPWQPKNDAVANFFPTTPMYYDILAMQAIYGRNLSHNAGNTSYTFNGNRTYFQTIDDAGGIDKIVYNGSTGCIISLTIKTFSSVGKAISFGDGTAFSSYTVCIGPNTVIENATGGSGSDVLKGNVANNILAGKSGDDNLFGLLGNDALVGGRGNDTMSGGLGFDRLTGGAGRDMLFGGGQADIFDFNAIGETGKSAATRDIIKDFRSTIDDIDLSTIDANGAAAGHAFVWRGGSGFTGGKGQLHYRFEGPAKTIVEGDINGDKVADFQIDVAGHKLLTAADFVL